MFVLQTVHRDCDTCRKVTTFPKVFGPIPSTHQHVFIYRRVFAIGFGCWAGACGPLRGGNVWCGVYIGYVDTSESPVRLVLINPLRILLNLSLQALLAWAGDQFFEPAKGHEK